MRLSAKDETCAFFPSGLIKKFYPDHSCLIRMARNTGSRSDNGLIELARKDHTEKFRKKYQADPIGDRILRQAEGMFECFMLSSRIQTVRGNCLNMAGNPQHLIRVNRHLDIEFIRRFRQINPGYLKSPIQTVI